MDTGSVYMDEQRLKFFGLLTLALGMSPQAVPLSWFGCGSKEKNLPVLEIEPWQSSLQPVTLLAELL
jgi:hypothetical protein